MGWLKPSISLRSVGDGNPRDGGLFMLQVVGSLAVLFAMVASFGVHQAIAAEQGGVGGATFAGCIGYRTPLDPDQEVHVGDARQDSGRKSGLSMPG